LQKTIKQLVHEKEKKEEDMGVEIVGENETYVNPAADV